MTAPIATTATKVGYVGGFGRSGSTLLEQILAAFPGVCALGEVVHLWERGLQRDELCSCGEPFSRCPFWQSVGDRAFGGWQHVDAGHVASLAAQVDRMRHIPTDLLTRTGSRRHATLREYAGYYAAVYTAAAEVGDARLVLDSSKHASTAYALRADPDIDLRVVHLVRDARGVAYSWTKTVRRPEGSAGTEHEEMYRYPPWRAAMLWDGHNAAFSILGHTGVPVERVLYEQLLADPTGQVRALAARLGLDPDRTSDVVTATSVNLGPSHQVAGNPMRFSHGEVALRTDDAWRRTLPAGSRRLVTALTAPLLLGYGYLGRSDAGTAT